MFTPTSASTHRRIKGKDEPVRIGGRLGAGRGVGAYSGAVNGCADGGSGFAYAIAQSATRYVHTG